MRGAEIAGIVIQGEDMVNIGCESRKMTIKYREETPDRKVDKIIEICAPPDKFKFF